MIDAEVELTITLRMETAAAPPPAPASAGGFSDAGNAGSRYDALLQQIVQLNTDLQKTAALSQTLQRERDDTQQLNVKLKADVKRLQERCDKMQLVLMQETEQKIDSDRKHEELIAKWKKQLEVKARAFESLQKKFAPPRDLEQLRIKIQEELEGPYQQRIDNLQDEVERHRQISFDMRREFEALKTEYEQYSINQSNEMECIHDTYEVTINDLRRKLQLAEDAATNSQQAENIRRLRQQREAAQIEIKALRDEVRDIREELQRVSEQSDNDRSTHELRLADEATRNATLELDLKACRRQLTRVKDECESIRSKWEHVQNKMLELASESEGLREQLKQKESLILSSHNSFSTKLRDERATWERGQATLKDCINELTLKLQTAEAAAQKASTQSRESNSDTTGHALLQKAREEEVERYRGLVAEAEKKIAAKEEALRQCQDEAEETTHNLRMEKESIQKVVQALESEKEVMVAKQTSSHELITRMKSECITLRSKLKEIENDYRTLQLKHREIIQYQEDIQLERDEVQEKLKFMEQDYAMLAEKLDKEKETHASAAQDSHRKYSRLQSDSQAQLAGLQRETRAALSKTLRELSKTQKKRDAYKRKCLEIHENYKQLVDETNRREAKLLQNRKEHTAELQQLLAQLSEAESDKTALMQRQIELGFPPPSAFTQKSSALRSTEPAQD
ncbi:Centrosomal protein [Phytophthora citrophthora]|uniref:Centrosomal protein n=1 Tax=Phytophthora citrophthora TaxID=4793 RepID=A0AAD9H009_9STRA|nr:Centrosomal protein [Phytophthora citrophthora]